MIVLSIIHARKYRQIIGFMMPSEIAIFFPSYYPNGDYHFFASFDWTIGLYVHPWKEEIIVVGEQLIQEFEKARKILNITEL